MKYITVERVIIVVLAIMLIFGGCWGKRKFDAQYSKIDSLSLANQAYSTLLNKANEKIYQQEVLITDNQQSIRELTDSVFNLKKSQDKRIKDVIAYYSERVKVRVDTFYVEYEEDSAYVFPEVDVECEQYLREILAKTIDVPKPIKIDSTDFSLDFTILKEGFRVNKIEFVDTQYIKLQEVKNGWFRPKKLEIQVKHTNKKINIVGQNSVVYIPKKKSGWLLNSLIFGIGVFLGTRL